MSFTTSFKHTSRVKWGIDFSNSNVVDVIDKLRELHNVMSAGSANNVHVGYDITLKDVDHVQNLLTIIINQYKELIAPTIPSNKKLYTIIEQVRQATTITTQQMAKDVINQIVTPQQNKKLSHKEQLEANADTMSKQRMLNLIKKTNAKKGN